MEQESLEEQPEQQIAQAIASMRSVERSLSARHRNDLPTPEQSPQRPAGEVE